MKKKPSISMILSVLIGVLLLAAEGLTVWEIHKLNILPGPLFTAILIGLAAVTALLALMLFPSRNSRKKTGRKVLQVIAIVLALLLTLGCTLGYLALAKLSQTFNAITQTPTVTAQIGVYVMTDDPAQTLEDSAGYRVGITPSYDGENTQKALQSIQAQLSSPYQMQDYDTVLAMASGLYIGDVQAVILNSAYISLLSEIEGFTDFLSRTRLLYQYDVVEVVEPTEPETQPTQASLPQPTDTEKPQADDPLYQPFVIYLSGSDTHTSFLSQSRSDVNILAAVNPRSKQILLVNTPRDYYVPNPAGNGALDKLTHCGIYGVDCSMEALAGLYGQPVTYYAQINFTGFETLIDAIGGITIYADEADGVYLQPGPNEMDGTLALEFARNRYSYADGDLARGRHQMQVIGAVVDKLTSGSIITNYADIMDSLQGMFITSVPNETISGYIKMQLSDMASWEVFSYSVSGYGSSEITYSMPGLYAYVMFPDDGMVAHASELIGKVLNGDRLTPGDI